MKPVVEEYPCLTRGQVNQAGGFQQSRTWSEIRGAMFRVRRPADRLEVSFNAGGTWKVVQVALKASTTPFGVAHEFICPISALPVRKLYVAEGRLGGRLGLGLDNLSHARPGASRMHAKLNAGRPRGSAAWGLDLPSQPVSTLQGWEQGQRLRHPEAALLKRLGSDLTAARSGEICSTRSKPIADWGWAWMQAQLDCDVLDKLGLIEPETRHAAAFAWELGHGDVETVLLQTDLAGNRSPLMVLRLYRGSEVSRQAIALKCVKARWRAYCPVRGEWVRVLYARAGRFASRRAQYLVRGERRPAAPFGDIPLVEDTWEPDELTQ